VVSDEARGFIVKLPPGSRIAGYRLEEQIGHGGMAVVFRARDESLGRLVALKILAPRLAGDEEFRQRFISESRAAAAIDDPHIVPVFAAGEADGVLFIAMRYVPGGDARSLLDQAGPLPPGRVIAIISAVASALDAAHGAGLLHRDVKPSNMLMDVVPGRPDHVYLSDFGLSKATASGSGLTGTGVVLGTVDYMSPEQVSGTQADGRADQYALACSAFELLSGATPFRREEPASVMHAHLIEPPPRLASVRLGLPPEADAVLATALAKAPGERYVSCGQFAGELRAALGFQPYEPVPAAHPVTVAAPPATRADAAATVTSVAAVGVTGDGSRGDALAAPKRPDPRRRRVVVAGAVAVAVLAAAGLAVGLLTGNAAGPAAVLAPVSVKSALPRVTGDVYVVYRGGTQADADVYGEVTKATDGEVAELFAQQFPFRKAPAEAGSVILHTTDGTARYEFQVAPALATRYQVKLFQSSTATKPFATSAVATIYVALGGSAANPVTCKRPVCHESLLMISYVPPAALATETAKVWYPYFAVNLAPSKVPPDPQWLIRDGAGGQVTASHRVSADEFTATVTFTFRVGNDAYSWDWNACSADTEAQDGIGLPGHHGCGDQRVLDSAAYLG